MGAKKEKATLYGLDVRDIWTSWLLTEEWSLAMGQHDTLTIILSVSQTGVTERVIFSLSSQTFVWFCHVNFCVSQWAWPKPVTILRI